MPIDTELEKLIINKNISKSQFIEAYENGLIGDNDLSLVNDNTEYDIIVDDFMSDTSENAVQNKIIKEYVDTTKQDKLISGTNIKTINNESILGDGNLSINSDIENKITNCIIEIPQDIKVELNNSIITAKAGSKVHIPNGFDENGQQKFETYVLPNDISYDISWNPNIRSVFLHPDRTQFIAQMTDGECFSGSTPPTAQNIMVWYDTTNNQVKITTDKGSTWWSGVSLPICIIDRTVEITQVFNGFSYIGLSRFILSGIKALIPNGRNEDGTLRNIEWTQPSCTVYTFPFDSVLYCTIGPESDSYTPYYEQKNKPNGGGLWYNPETNYLYRSTDNGATWTIRTATLYCIVKITEKITNTLITSVQTKLPFRAFDASEADYVVESYVNGTEWYRVYKSGWIEQGGITLSEESNSYLVTLYKSYKDTKYNVSVTGKSLSATEKGWNSAHTLTTTNFKVVQPGSGCFWEAKGKGE